MDDAADRDRWAWFARTGAARGIASSLSLPVVRDGRVVGGINLYAVTDHAFDGHVDELAAALGADAATAVTDADLSFASGQQAASTPSRLRERQDVDTAVGMLAARHRESLAASRTRLATAAGRAGISQPLAARVVLDLHTGGTG
jgi:GAF domain-containing protein